MNSLTFLDLNKNPNVDFNLISPIYKDVNKEGNLYENDRMSSRNDSSQDKFSKLAKSLHG